MFSDEYYGKIVYDWQTEYKLTLPTYPVVFTAIKLNQCRTQAEVVELTGLAISTVQRILKDLQDVGLIEKVYVVKGEYAEL